MGQISQVQFNCNRFNMKSCIQVQKPLCKTTIKAISIQVAWLSKFHSQLGLVNRYAMSLEREAKSDFRTYPYLSVPIRTKMLTPGIICSFYAHTLRTLTKLECCRQQQSDGRNHGMRNGGKNCRCLDRTPNPSGEGDGCREEERPGLLRQALKTGTRSARGRDKKAVWDSI